MVYEGTFEAAIGTSTRRIYAAEEISGVLTIVINTLICTWNRRSL